MSFTAEPPYPDEDDLDRLHRWAPEDIPGALNFAMQIWSEYGKAEYAEDQQDRIWTFGTGGWSGNEDIIQALRDNRALWTIAWFSSERGGKHVFKILNIPSFGSAS